MTMMHVVEDGTMGPLLKKEVVTTHQPDGTITTKTTEMRTVESAEYDYDESEFNCVYCCTPIATLRVVQIIVGFIIVGLVTAVRGSGPFVGVLGGQTYVLIVACCCIIITFIILTVYLFGCHLHIMQAFPWRIFDLVYSVIAVILLLIAGCVEAWYAGGAWQQGTILPKWWGQSECKYLGSDTNQYDCPIFVPWVIAAGFIFVNVVLYAIGACLAAMGKYYL